MIREEAVLSARGADVSKLDVRVSCLTGTLCVAGDPQMKFTKVSSIPGAAGATPKFTPWKRPEVEVLAVGESRKWETAECVRDAVTEGKRKALVNLEPIPSVGGEARERRFREYE